MERLWTRRISRRIQACYGATLYRHPNKTTPFVTSTAISRLSDSDSDSDSASDSDTGSQNCGAVICSGPMVEGVQQSGLMQWSVARWTQCWHLANRSQVWPTLGQSLHFTGPPCVQNVTRPTVDNCALKNFLIKIQRGQNYLMSLDGTEMCADVCRCVPMCADVCQCVPMCADVCQAVPMCADVCQCVPMCANVCQCASGATEFRVRQLHFDFVITVWTTLNGQFNFNNIIYHLHCFK